MKIQAPKKSARAGFTLSEIIVVVAVIAVLAALYVRQSTRRVRPGYCGSNLKQIGLAFQIWADDNNGKFPMQVSVTNHGTRELVSSGLPYKHFQVLSNEMSSSTKIPVCPEDKHRTYAVSFEQGFSHSNVSYFIAVDADMNQPAMLLAGDDNLTIGGVPVKPGMLLFRTNSPVAWTKARHENLGNIAFADGSVQSLTTAQLRERLAQTGMATNRLAMP